MILTDVLKLIGNRRDERNTNRTNTAEDARLEALERRRALGRASLMRGILQSAGYGQSMTDEQMFDMLLRPQRRNTRPMSSILPGIAGIGQRLEDTVVRGSAAMATGGMSEAAPQATNAASSFFDLLRGMNGSTISPPPR